MLIQISIINRSFAQDSGSSRYDVATTLYSEGRSTNSNDRQSTIYTNSHGKQEIYTETIVDYVNPYPLSKDPFSLSFGPFAVDPYGVLISSSYYCSFDPNTGTVGLRGDYFF